MTGSVVNFAYGSNMLFARIRRRVLSARLLGVATLRGHELRWHKAGMDGSGKCDVVPSDDPDAVVYGVLFEIPTAEKADLDKAEGLGEGYAEKRVVVDVGGVDVEAWLYYAIRVDPSLKPYSWYKALVVEGARRNGFPADYVAALECVECSVDPDTERHTVHMAIAKAE